MAPPQLRYDVERQLFDWFGQFYTAISGSDISEGGSGCVEHLLYRALPPKQCALWSAFFYKHNNNRERLSFDDVPITRFRFIDVPHCDHSAVKSAFEAFADNATPDNHVKLLATLPLQAPKVGVSQRNNGTFPRKQSPPTAHDNDVDDSTDSSRLSDSDGEESSEDDHGFYGVDGQEDSSTTLGRTASQSGTVRWHRGALHLSAQPLRRCLNLVAGTHSPSLGLPLSAYPLDHPVILDHTTMTSWKPVAALYKGN
ncbi:unnamed protein product [Tilletia controversa]|nr:unnamed protein product [Tilletia controversa]